MRTYHKSPENQPLAAGRYLAEVSSCEEKMSQKNEPYYNFGFVLADNPERFLCYDVAMLVGAGQGMGIVKLRALEACVEIGDDIQVAEPQDIVGRHVWITVKLEEYDGKTKRVVDARAPGCGYEAYAEPENTETTEVSGNAEDIPF